MKERKISRREAVVTLLISGLDIKNFLIKIGSQPGQPEAEKVVEITTKMILEADSPSEVLAGLNVTNEEEGVVIGLTENELVGFVIKEQALNTIRVIRAILEDNVDTSKRNQIVATISLTSDQLRKILRADENDESVDWVA